MAAQEIAWNPKNRLWTSDLLLGIPLIDSQHKQLINELEKFLTAIYHGKDYGKIRGLAAFFQTYTFEHFQSEESFMHKFKYPGVDKQIQQHAIYRESVQKVRQFVRINPASPESLKLVESTMFRWYVGHIKKVDMEFATFLKENDLLKEYN